MRRIEERRRGDSPRPGALAADRPQADLQPPRPLPQASPTPSSAGASEKIELLDELVGTVMAEDGAVLVFTQYVAMARLLERHLTRHGVAHQFLHGGTPVREREAMVARFQAGEAPVFLLSLKAGGTGLNLTRADHVIHFDRWWNPAVEDQATDRAYRIGQTRPVQVHRLVTQGTIEEKIAELLGTQALARRLGAGPRRDGADRAVRRRAARPGDAATPAVRRSATDGHPSAARVPAAAAAPPPGGARRGSGPSRRRRSASRTSARPGARPRGRVGGITVEPGRFAGRGRGGPRRLHRRGHRARCSTPPTSGRFVELVAAESGRIARPARRPAAPRARRAGRGGGRRAAALRRRAGLGLLQLRAPGSTRARTPWRCSPSWRGCSRPTRSC